MDTPLVTVLMPVYNAAQTLERAVNSVLAQTYSELEIVTVDDGSSDESPAILQSIRDPRLRTIRLPKNEGIVGALNAGLEVARGEFVARQDADDVADPRRIALQIEALLQDPLLGAVGSYLRLVDDSDQAMGTWTYPVDAMHARWQMMFKTPVPHAAVVFRKAAVTRAGGYRREFELAEDYDLWSRMGMFCDLRSLPESLVTYRVGATGISRQRAEKQREVHVSIASRNMCGLLGRSVSISAVEALAFGVDERKFRTSSSDAANALDLLCDLYSAFTKSSSVSALLTADARWRALRLLKSIPFSERITAVRQLWPRLNANLRSPLGLVRLGLP